jgi:hypothetical protein
MSVRSVSYGGGVQSTALLVLAAQKRIDFDLFLFANTGDDSEHPATLAYVRDIAMPYAEANGIEVLELSRHRRDGTIETLWGRMHNGNKSVPIPYRNTKDGKPMSRSCTADFKTRVIGKELKRRGATAVDPATVALGISVDEIERAKPGLDPMALFQFRVYPLLDLGLHRRHCSELIADAGLPVPPKSACWFCPHHDKDAWRKLKRETPGLFAASCELESDLAVRRGAPVFLTRHGRPLAETLDDQLTLDGLDDCESGWCMT